MTRHRTDTVAPAELVALVEEHAVWRKVWSYLTRDACIELRVPERPENAWHLQRTERGAALRPGAAEGADASLVLSRGALHRLLEVECELGEAIYRLLRAAFGDEAGERIDVRVNAPYERLLEHGVISLLIAGGLRCRALGARHGVRSLHDLRGVIESSRDPRADAPSSPSAAHVGDAGLRMRLRRAAREITGQHRRLRELSKAVHAAIEAGDAEALRRAAQAYRVALGAHFDLEERIVLPALHGLVPHRADEIDALMQEHSEFFGRLVALAERDVSDVEWRAAFYELGRALAIHECKEEGLFSAAVAGRRGGKAVHRTRTSAG